MSEFLIKSLNEFSVVWAFISATIGGIIGASVKFTFENILGPRIKDDRAYKAKVKEIKAPLTNYVDSLDRRIENFLRFGHLNWYQDTSNLYYKISTLYLVGVYFGICNLFQKKIYFIHAPKYKKAKHFNIFYNRVFKSLTSHYYFKEMTKYSSMPTYNIPRLMIESIGELMTNPLLASKKTGIIEFNVFYDLFQKDEKYQFWFERVDLLFFDFKNSTTNINQNRLAILGVALRMFLTHLDPDSYQHRKRSYEHYFQYLDEKVKDKIISEINKIV